MRGILFLSPFHFFHLPLGIIVVLGGSEWLQGVYLLVLGVTASFFVCWHFTALYVGVYNRFMKSDNQKGFYLRVWHLGAFALIVGTITMSILIWGEFQESLSLDVVTPLQGTVVSFLAMAYAMIFYCIFECLVDGCYLDTFPCQAESTSETISGV